MVTIIHHIPEKTDNTLSYGWLILTRNACDVFWGVKCKNSKKGQTTRIESFHLSDLEWTLHKHQLPWWLSCLATGKNSPANAGGMGSTPGVGRSPGKGNGNLLQHSCLENSMEKETWWPYSQWSPKESDTTEHARTHCPYMPPQYLVRNAGVKCDLIRLAEEKISIQTRIW